MTARRVGSLQRRRARVLVGLLAALIATLAPVESPISLGPLEDLPGAATAEAQTPAVGPGTPDPCPVPLKPDSNDASLCVLSQVACSEHPLHAAYPLLAAHPLHTGPYLVPSTEFPDFCEATVLDSQDLAAYTACTALAGYVIKTFTQGSDQACRMIRPAECASSMHRTGVNTCRRVQRRTWSCPAGATPTNQFNRCYQQPPDYTGAHPACQAGAPSFAISSCEEYVGQDFVRAPASVQCSSFDTGNTGPKLRDLTGASNRYWCQFDSSYLDAGCHGAGAPCPAADAVCVKRASTTGGCDAIAKAINCRSLQAAYLAGSRTAEDVYLQGCTPCAVLPFSPTPLYCPQDLRTNPTRSTISQLEDTHQLRYDWGDSSKSTPASSSCSDPRHGRLVWESSHHSGLAVVNSPVVLRVDDLPSQTRPVQYVRKVGMRHGNPPGLRGFGTVTREYLVYADSAPGDTTVRAWPTFDTTLTYGSVDKIDWNGSPCLVRSRPDFRVRVEELWPDSDAPEIQALFGSDALAWWTALTAAQKMSRTAARGAKFTQVVRCNYDADVWCNWRPARPGYYRLVAAGAWQLQSLTDSRSWLPPGSWALVDSVLMDMYRARDGNCPNPLIYRHTDHDCLRDSLTILGLTPEEAGLEPDLSGLLPKGSSDEWPYTDAAGPNICPPRDMRLYCSGSASWNYTESEPIGIVVHEVRVSTVTPDR